MLLTANYYDGRSARRHVVELSSSDGMLVLGNAELRKTYPLRSLDIVEPFAGAPLVVNMHDGGHVEIHDEHDKRAISELLAFRKTLVMRLQERWATALGAVVALCALLFATVEWGIPAAAEKLVTMAPVTLDDSFGQVAMQKLSEDLVRPSRLSDQRIAEVQAMFDSIKPANPRRPLRMLVRDVPAIGVNAFALPDGTIVMTDAMIKKVLDGSEVMDDFGRHQLLGVFAHEIGHVQHRHSMRAIARSSLTVALSATLFGDFSAVASTAPAILLRATHSREMETEADTYALALMTQHQVPTGPLATLFEDLKKESQAKMDKILPGWMQRGLGYMASHPSGDTRAALFGGPVPRPKASP